MTEELKDIKKLGRSIDSCSLIDLISPLLKLKVAISADVVSIVVELTAFGNRDVGYRIFALS